MSLFVGNVSKRLSELGIVMPPPPRPAGMFLTAKRVGNLVYASGQTPKVAGDLIIRGKVGAEVTEEEARQAARVAVLNCLAAIVELIGTLDRVKQVVRLTGYVAGTFGFGRQPAVIDAASEFLRELFGPAGEHARSAIGVAELPGNAPVEVELIVEVED